MDKVSTGMQGAAESVQSAASAVNLDTLPQINGLARDARQAVRSIDQAANQFSDSPQSLLFGGTTTVPGPGESGFKAPQPAASAAAPPTGLQPLATGRQP